MMGTIDYWSFGPRKSAPIGGFTIHRSPVRVLPGLYALGCTTLPPSNQSLAVIFGDGPADSWSIGLWGVALGAARNGGGGGGEESSKKRTLRFLRWAAENDPKETLRLKSKEVSSCLRGRFTTLALGHTSLS